MDIVHILLETGADPNTANLRDGSTALTVVVIPHIAIPGQEFVLAES